MSEGDEWHVRQEGAVGLTISYPVTQEVNSAMLFDDVAALVAEIDSSLIDYVRIILNGEASLLLQSLAKTQGEPPWLLGLLIEFGQGLQVSDCQQFEGRLGFFNRE